MGFEVRSDDGGSFYAVFPQRQDELAAAEYARFRGCIAQLLDDETLIGDVEGRWVIFQHGWVYGMATYASKADAIAFGRQMFRDEPEAVYIVVNVDLDAHSITGMHALASAIPDFDPTDIEAKEAEASAKEAGQEGTVLD